MVTRFNFATEESSNPRGYVLDFGEAYSSEEGYGWVEQADLTTPLDVTANARERDLSNNQLIDTFIHMQYPLDIPNPNAVTTPAAWVHDVKNGRYRVSVGVGDLLINDSSHTINVEDVSLISNYEPESNNSVRFNGGIVDVTDGQLTVDAVGGENTKILLFEFFPLAGAWINFGTEDTPISDDYIKDVGQGYSDSRGYGWVTQESLGRPEAEPIDITLNGRERNLINDIRQDSLIHMQYPNFPGAEALTTPAAWEYSLSNGDYRVTVEVGDPGFIDSTHVINVEDINFIDEFVPTTDEPFQTATQVVTVDDEKLTVDAIGGVNTKLNSIRITPVTDVKINFGPENATGVSEDYYSDFGSAYSEDRGYGWITQDSANSNNSIPTDNTDNIRFRNAGEDPLLKSLIHMQYPDYADKITANRTPVAWEYDIPNGEYEVRVGVGDPAYIDSIHVVNIEDVNVVSAFVPSVDNRSFTATETIEVTDGKLTVDAIGGENTKLNFIEISSI